MRTIKFRAWDKESKQMKRCGIYPDGVPMAYAGGDNAIALYDRPLMQFTGLLDKNGKEIYEGDIVTHNLYAKESDRTGHSNPVAIIWDKERCGFDFDRSGYKAGLFYDEYEIIGNIYENPELIK